ncbi:MAG TPA: hypothetical protein VM344_06560, partial [Vitreimonas sp.]|nr:hypothetical protein [Vitreimonas sp.]
MTDDLAASPDGSICPWCSAELPPEALETCTWCGAKLAGEPDVPVPGVTALDAEAIVRAARTVAPQRRSRLLTWITGEDADDGDTVAPPGSVDPPAPEVRREMLRMELEAEVAELQAEVGALAADAREAGLDE